MVFELHPETESIQHNLDFAEPPIVSPEASVAEVFDFLRRSPDGCVLICRENRLIGIFTERDGLRLMTRPTDWQQPIENVMVREVVSVANTATVKEAINKMYEGAFRHLPVVDQRQKPVGLIKVSHILRYLVQHVPKPVYNLPPEPNHAMQTREGA